jgi:Methylase-associated X1
VPASGEVAGRAYARIYRVSGRADLREFLIDAVARSGGTLLYASEPGRTPLYLGVQAEGDERLGMLCYPFRCNPPPIKGRRADEHRLQIRYGGEPTWGEDHPLGRDIAGVDVSLVLGVHLQEDLLIGLDALLYDPLPMGISIEFKDADVAVVRERGWHAWQRENRGGSRRPDRRSLYGTETIVGLRPDWLLDYARFERQATALGLDSSLRLRGALAAAGAAPAVGGARHALEEEFELHSAEILEVIRTRMRLAVAVRGGIAEHHLERHLREDPQVAEARRLDEDGRPDFEVTLADGRLLLVECKNVSPEPYRGGDLKVEVQKTRSSKGAPESRLYRPDQFEVVAACLFPATRRWEFRFKATAGLARDQRYPDRLAPIQRVDPSWADRLVAATPQS